MCDHFAVLDLYFSHVFSSRAIAFVLVFIVHLRQFFPACVAAADTKITKIDPLSLTCTTSCFTAVIFILRPLIHDES